MMKRIMTRVFLGRNFLAIDDAPTSSADFIRYMFSDMRWQGLREACAEDSPLLRSFPAYHMSFLVLHAAAFRFYKLVPYL